MTFPKYVMIGNTEMILIKVEKEIATYYRHAGGWDIRVFPRFSKEGRRALFTVHNYEHLNDLRVRPIPKRVWLKANEAYL